MKKVKKIWFMFRRFLTDWREKNDHELFVSHEPELGYYYFKFTVEKINARGGNKAFDFDEKGVPRIHSYIDVEGGGYYYYPITIGQYGLAVYHNYLDHKREEDKQLFINIADWFLESKIEDEKYGVYWLTETPKPEYKIDQPWKSAFSQSRGISILLRAWQLTGDTKYKEPVPWALKLFNVPINEGGAMVFTKYGRFYEEYATNQPTMVLDGHIFSMFGLMDAVRALNGPEDKEAQAFAKQLLDDGMESLKQWLPVYDMGYWLEFNQCNMPHYPETDPCTIGYLRLISQQLLVLYNYSGKKEFKEFREKLLKYDRLPNIFRMYLVKYKALKKLNRV